jgi:hypothetical protein
LDPGRAAELCPQIWTQLQTNQTPQSLDFVSIRDGSKFGGQCDATTMPKYFTRFSFVGGDSFG